MKDSLSEEQKVKIIKDADELAKHQNQLQDPSILPCISINDIPADCEKVDFKIYEVAHGNIKIK